MPTLQVAIESRKAEDGSRKFTASLKAMRSASKGVDGSLLRTERRVKRLGKTASGVGGILKKAFSFVTGAIAMSMGVRRVVSTLITFEKNMAELRAVTGATENTFQNFTDRARELGATTRFTAGQAAEGMTFLARTGLDAEEVIAAIGPSLNLASAGMLDLGTAADIASNVMSQFALRAGDLEHITDVLVNTSNSANTNVQQLAEAMKMAGPVAGAVGITLEETAAALGSLGDAGLQASLAGTNLRGIMSALLKPTGEARDAIADLGLNAQELNPAFSSLTEIFDQFSASTFGAEEATAIFGRRNMAAALVLTRLNEKTKTLTETNKGLTGTAEEQARVMNDTLLGAWQELNSAVDEVILGVGDTGLNKFLRDIVDGMTEVIRKLGPVVETISLAFIEIKESFSKTSTSITKVGKTIFDKLSFGLGVFALALKTGLMSIAPAFDFVFGHMASFVGETEDSTLTITEAFIKMSAAVQRSFIKIGLEARLLFEEIIHKAELATKMVTGFFDWSNDEVIKGMRTAFADKKRDIRTFAAGIIRETNKTERAALDAEKAANAASAVERDADRGKRKADSEERVRIARETMEEANEFLLKNPEQVAAETKTLTEATSDFWKQYKINATSNIAIVNEGLGTGMSALEDFAVAAIRDAESVGEAFEKLADAIQDSITRILVRLATTALFEGLASGLGATKTTQSAFRGDSSARIGTSNITATGTTSSVVAQHGGSFLMRGPQSGFAAPLTLHGMERVDVTPLGRERRDSGVVVNIINKSEAKVEERSQKESNGTTSISLVISNAISKDIRNGGGVNRAIRDVFGADVKTGGR